MQHCMLLGRDTSVGVMASSDRIRCVEPTRVRFTDTQLSQ
jgi:hypothetical protein